MKDININYDALSFEEKVNLKLNYMYSLPRTESSIRTGIVTLSWIKTLLIDERIEPEVFSIKNESSYAYYTNRRSQKWID